MIYLFFTNVVIGESSNSIYSTSF